jgi:hypothetical protein
MRTGAVFPLRALFSLALAMACLSVLAPGDDGPQRWVTTWTTANAASDRPTAFSNQTIREVVRTTIGGSTVRIRLSNTFGTRPVPRSNHEVTFGGSRSIATPSRLAPQYDSGDHLHPGPVGHEAMGNAVDLALFR